MVSRAGPVVGAYDRVSLLERGSELAALEGLLAAAQTGEGSLAVIEGPAGIGKTALLEAARERAGARGADVRLARASELEREFAYGVVRQLLEPVVTGSRRLLERLSSTARPLAGRLARPPAQAD